MLVFHGGPGGSFKARHAQDFDLKKYRIIGFDQRGSGKSLPSGQWNKNTSADIIKDTERLLKELKIFDSLIVKGASWGAALALKFAETYPKQVRALILNSVFLADEDAARWEEEDAAYFIRIFWTRLRRGFRNGRTFRPIMPKWFVRENGKSNNTQ